MLNPGITHVAMLMGGWSREREVSLASGRACTKALDEAGFKVSMIDVKRDIAQVLAEMRPDVVFNALHGKWGEDGAVQGILETLQIPYTHSGVLASALAMDKQRSKAVFDKAGIGLAESKVVDLEEAASVHPMALPYVIKPVAEGSSIGVHIVDHGSNAPPAGLLDQREEIGDQVMIERFVPGRELSCSVMGGVALGVTEIEAAAGFYDYKAKYEEGGSQHTLPAEIPRDIYRKVQRQSLAAHDALGCKGVSRADFRYNDLPGGEGELVMLEVNTQPGMTATSLVPEAAAHAGHSFSDFVTWIINDASCDR